MDSYYREKLLSMSIARELEMSLMDLRTLQQALLACSEATTLEDVRKIVEQAQGNNEDQS
jgi:hypothetical protein